MKGVRSRCVLLESIKTHVGDRFRKVEHDVFPKSGIHFSASCSSLLAAGMLLVAACDSGTVQRDEVSSTRVVMRPDAPIPPGTVPRGTIADRAAEAAPPPDLAAAASAGRARYEIFCTPCHG